MTARAERFSPEEHAALLVYDKAGRMGRSTKRKLGFCASCWAPAVSGGKCRFRHDNGRCDPDWFAGGKFGSQAKAAFSENGITPASPSGSRTAEGLRAPWFRLRRRNAGMVRVRDERVRAYVLNRARGVCECGCGVPFPYLEVHHIDPLATGGADRVGNAVALRPDCHARATRETEFNEVLRSTPR